MNSVRSGGKIAVRYNVHNEVRVCGKERHLTFRIASRIGGFLEKMLTRLLMSWFPCPILQARREESFEDCPRFEKRFDPERAEFAVVLE